MRSNAASTSATVSGGSAAGAGRSRSVAQPTPIWRWVSSPDSHATAAGVSAGPVSRSSSASRSTFALRAERVAHGGGGVDELAEQHAGMVSGCAAVSLRSEYHQARIRPPPDATELVLVRHGASAAAVPGEEFSSSKARAIRRCARGPSRPARGAAARRRSLIGPVRRVRSPRTRLDGRADRRRMRTEPTFVGRPARGEHRRTRGRRVPHRRRPRRPDHRPPARGRALGRDPRRRADGGFAARVRASAAESSRPARARRSSSPTAVSSPSCAGRPPAAARSRS